MAGATCHELSQPLQSAYIQCELAMNQLDQSQDLYRRLSTIQSDLNKLGDLTNKIQRITRYETTEYLGESTIIDINKSSE